MKRRKRVWELQFTNRELVEVSALESFWRAHYPHAPFYWRYDGFTPARYYTVRFAGKLKIVQKGACDFDCAVQLVEA